MFVLSKKLKLLKEKLKIWNKECFGNVHDYVVSAEQHLQLIQDQIQINGATDDLLNDELLAQKKFEDKQYGLFFDYSALDKLDKKPEE
jgi:hypothetical protein